MGSTVVVTGVAGFLGRHVARHFSEQGWRVVGFDVAPSAMAQMAGVDYRSGRLPGAEFEEALGEVAPQVCIHCAGCASVGMSIDDPETDFRGNTVLVFELLDALRRRAPACRFVLLSSAAVYGDPASLPVTEEHPIQPLSPYGFHKRQAEILCEEFSKVYSLPTASARVFSAYGSGLRRQVIWDICSKALGTGPLKLRGTGKESRDFIHAADIASGLYSIASSGLMTGESYNLASGSEVTIFELARRMAKILAVEKEIEFDGVAPAGNPLNWRADITRISALGFRPQIDFDAGLDAFARWTKKELDRR